MGAKTITTANEKTTCAPTKVQSTITAFKVVKSSAPKRRTKKFLQALQRPTPPPGRRYPVKILENGLVSTETTPDYLVAAVKRNALESPLLRLPLKVRKMIWAFALGGNTVEIKLRSANGASTNARSGSESLYQGYAAVPGPPGRKIKKLRTAFRLPEVCRNIYHETATLGYALNDFVFAGEIPVCFGRHDAPDGALEGWAMERIPAQLHAITTIRPHWMDVTNQLDRENHMRAFKQFYPSLNKLLVPKRTVSLEANTPDRGDPMRKFLRQQAKENIASRIKEQEGTCVEVVF